MIRHSRATTKNPDVEDWTKDYGAAGNLEFFRAGLDAFAKRGVGNGGLMVIGLLGQRDIPGHTVRVAQSILRWDARPSLWSHAFLIAGKVGPKPEDLAEAPVWGAPLHDCGDGFPKPEWNGVDVSRLGGYQNTKIHANAALLAVAMTDEEAGRVKARARDPNLDRARYNLWESLGVWKGFLWSQGVRPNPLRDGVPVVCSAYVEYAYEAISLDLSPAASERNSAPEHLWNGALWWHEEFKEFQHQVHGFCVLRDPEGSLANAGPLRLPE